jgi:hypothetical protein
MPLWPWLTQGGSPGWSVFPAGHVPGAPDVPEVIIADLPWGASASGNGERCPRDRKQVDLSPDFCGGEKSVAHRGSSLSPAREWGGERPGVPAGGLAEVQSFVLTHTFT